MARLSIINSKGEKSLYPLHSSTVSIGRGKDNDLVLDEPTVSRHHAKLERRDRHTFIIDQNSRNGTFVNNLWVREKELADKDRILIGSVTLVFEDIAAEAVVLCEEHKDLSQDAGAIVKPSSSEAEALDNYLAIPPQDSEELKKRQKNLLILYEVNKKLTSTIELEELLELIMNLIFEVIKADRGFIMLIDQATGELVPRVVKSREEAPKKHEFTLSRTIADKVISEKTSILTKDASQDARFVSGTSIALQHIKSALCVPIQKEGNVLGIIYLDSVSLTEQFSESELDLLTAIGNLAAIGIEHARLNERFRNEVQLRASLERYHSPAVVDHILKESVEKKDICLASMEIEASILFCDIKGFTTLSERLSPPEVALLLNEYFGVMTEIVFSFGGTVDKYIGDCIMAVFGAPLKSNDHAQKAVETALKMCSELEKIVSNKPAHKAFSIGIGVNTGCVVSGNIGCLKRLEYTVLGDTVNIAQRIESLTAANQILVGPRTYELTKDLFRFERMGPQQLKGTTRKIAVYEVLGCK